MSGIHQSFSNLLSKLLQMLTVLLIVAIMRCTVLCGSGLQASAVGSLCLVNSFCSVLLNSVRSVLLNCFALFCSTLIGLFQSAPALRYLFWLCSDMSCHFQGMLRNPVNGFRVFYLRLDMY